MEENYYDDDDYRVRRERTNRSNPAVWLIPLLLLPLAFLGGWVSGEYVNEGQINSIPGIQTGVGGGPDNNKELVSPIPVASTPTPTAVPSPTKNVTPSPAEE